jgi:hypothetical protein
MHKELRMNRTYLALLALLSAALFALAGCGGDGVDENLHQRVVDERDAAKEKAEAERKAKEEAEAKAEAERKAKEEAEAKAEAERKAKEEAEAREKDAKDKADAALQAEKDAASTAYEAAKTASENAATKAKEAEDAKANILPMQTNVESIALAVEAQEAAASARAEYNKAKKNSDDAAAATDLVAALDARREVEKNSEAAKGFEKTATEKSTASQDAAMKEVKIVGKTISVGESSINTDATAESRTIDDWTTITGNINAKTPKHVTAAVTGVAEVQDNPETADTNEARAPVHAVAPTTLNLGKTLDDPDDTARLMLITDYVGSKMGKVALLDMGESILVESTAVEDINKIHYGYEGDDLSRPPLITDLKLVGQYYLIRNGDGDGSFTSADAVTGDARLVNVYTFYDSVDEIDYHVILESTWASPSGEFAGRAFRSVQTHVRVPANGTAPMVEKETKATIPDKSAYKHINFGVWAALNNAEKDGSQSLSELGIGFVHNHSGQGMTAADMPNNGSATYSGSWAASVQGKDMDGDGAIMLEYGDASLAADFSNAMITADLKMLAKLSGSISENTFSGTKASDITHTQLDAEAAFTGKFSGAFYGPKAAEAGGIFDFTTADRKGGAFRGAFGADRKE